MRPIGQIGRIAAAALLTLAISAHAATVDELAAQMAKIDATDGQQAADALLKLGAPAIKALCAKLTPPPKGGDVNERFTLHGLALYVARPNAEAERTLYVAAIVPAMEAATNREIKAFLIRQLQLAGKDDAVPALAKLLGTKQYHEPATQALTRIRTPKAIEALLTALPAAKGGQRVTLIRALARLRAKAATATLMKDAMSDDRDIRLAALYGLANIGSHAAVGVLARAAEAKPLYERNRATTFALLLARRLAEGGDKAQCAKICRDLIKSRPVPRERHVVSAALKTLVDVFGAEALPDVFAATDHADKQLRHAALKLVQAMPGEAITAKCVARIKQARPEVRAAYLDMLSRRGDKTALPALIAAIKDADKGVRIAALTAAARLGGKDAVPAIVAAMNTDQADEATAARNVLTWLACPKDMTTLAAALPDTTPDARRMLVELLGTRRASGQADAVFAAAADKDANLRLAAIKALGQLADEKALPRLVALLVTVKSSRERGAAQRAVVAACERVPDAERRAAPLLAVLPNAKDDTRATLLRTMARVGGTKALAAVVADVKSPDAKLQDAAVRALSEWGDVSAASQQLTIVRTATKLTHQVLAMRGYVRVVGASPLPAGRKIRMYQDAIAVAKRPEEKRLVLSGLAGVRTPQSLRVVAPFLDDKALAAEAAIAVVKIACPQGKKDKGLLTPEALVALKKVVAVAKDANTRKQAQSQLNRIPKSDTLNIACGKPATTNVQAQGGRSPQNAVDGNAALASAWYGAKWPCWFQVDLGKPAQIDSAHVFFYWDGSRYYQYKIDTSLDAKAWATVVDASKTTTPCTARGTIHNFKPVTARYVRLHILKNSVNEAVHLIELKVYATGTGPKAPKPPAPPKPDKEGFVPLFNGKDLTGWAGATKGYVPENGLLVCHKKGGGQLYTTRDYANFIVRLDFKLEAGGNNGLAIHNPPGGHAAYQGIELQILDNTAKRYAKLAPYQYHGSVYGCVPAKRGFLKPVGEWNHQEVTVKGTKIKVVLNGTAIVDTDLAPIIASGKTMDGRGIKGHPGLLRKTGRIGFLGHGARVEFRNIRIKELP